LERVRRMFPDLWVRFERRYDELADDLTPRSPNDLVLDLLANPADRELVNGFFRRYPVDVLNMSEDQAGFQFTDKYEAEYDKLNGQGKDKERLAVPINCKNWLRVALKNVFAFGDGNKKTNWWTEHANGPLAPRLERAIDELDRKATPKKLYDRIVAGLGGGGGNGVVGDGVDVGGNVTGLDHNDEGEEGEQEAEERGDHRHPTDVDHQVFQARAG
jgi:hypothetical protein